jgi:hypothetical protein
MSAKTIFCVGVSLPGDEFEEIPFDSNRSLLDADIVLFEPSLAPYEGYKYYEGKPLIGEYDSAVVLDHLAHWRSELVAATNAGKLVIIYLARPSDVYRHTGRNQYSGTGRNRQVTNIVEPVRSYAAVPTVERAVISEGLGMKLCNRCEFLMPYWNVAAAYSRYEVYVEGKFGQIVLQTKSGDRTLGALVRGRGSLLFLPPIRYPDEEFIKWDEKGENGKWTDAALKFGKRLVQGLVVLSDSLTGNSAVTPMPEWANESAYQIQQERDVIEKVSLIDSEIASLKKSREELEQERLKASCLRGLLYEKGRPLELAILDALRALGFVADGHKEGESEFDAVFVSPEGRFLGEAEGKDLKPINIDKLGQLERNLQEDFQRDEVREYAKGVLFGNADRLAPPDRRGDAFTAKCVSGAKRAKIALVRTIDLFSPAKYLKEYADEEYAKRCRVAIFAAEGEVVGFPPVPVQEEISAAEDTEKKETD